MDPPDPEDPGPGEGAGATELDYDPSLNKLIGKVSTTIFPEFDGFPEFEEEGDTLYDPYCECILFWLDTFARVEMAHYAPNGALVESGEALNKPYVEMPIYGTPLMPGTWVVKAAHFQVKLWMYADGTPAYTTKHLIDVTQDTAIVPAQGDATLKLFLDVPNAAGGYNFNPQISTNGQDDAPTFVPGSRLDGSTAVISDSQSQSVRLIAAYVNANGTIVPPPSNTPVSFLLPEVSEFRGYAMNAGASTDPDYSLASTGPVAWSGSIAQVQLNVRDYGGFVRVRVEHGSATPVELRLPRDSVNNNTLPDVGWTTPAGLVPDQGLGGNDDLETGGGTDGDGLTAWEEYRGFVVNNQHRRLNPGTRDMFVNSLVSGGVGDAVNLGLTVHHILANEMDTQDRINANYVNGTAGDLPCPPVGQPSSGPCHFDQRALRIVYGGFKLADNQTDLIIGETERRNTGSYVPPYAGPSTIRWIRVFEESIQAASPTNNDQFVPELPIDQEATRHNLGHEVGHALGLGDPHPPPAACPPGAVTLMVTGYLIQTTNAADGRWTSIPHDYTPQEKNAIRLR